MGDVLKIGAVLYALWFLTRKPAQPAAAQPAAAPKTAAPKPAAAPQPPAQAAASEPSIVAASHIQVKP